MENKTIIILKELKLVFLTRKNVQKILQIHIFPARKTLINLRILFDKVKLMENEKWKRI